MAHKTGTGSTKNGRDSNPKYLGIKLNHRQSIKAGGIIVRQRGLCHKPGQNVKLGKDFTIYSTIDGFVHFSKSGHIVVISDKVSEK